MLVVRSLRLDPATCVFSDRAKSSWECCFFLGYTTAIVSCHHNKHKPDSTGHGSYKTCSCTVIRVPQHQSPPTLTNLPTLLQRTKTSTVRLPNSHREETHVTTTRPRKQSPTNNNRQHGTHSCFHVSVFSKNAHGHQCRSQTCGFMGFDRKCNVSWQSAADPEWMSADVSPSIK